GADGGASATTAARGTESPRRRVSFNVKVKIDQPAEWAEMFDDAWRTMKYRFYDPQMHGKDWDAARAKYQPLVEHVGDRQELLNTTVECSGGRVHPPAGAAPPRGGRRGGVSTALFGLVWVEGGRGGGCGVSSV